ncbi:hypothetical protein JW933_09210 [candidate division FCPU426 bacterium]|nr:hypothetical protein [candidate division FCPU426 bacterium]
MSWSGGDKTKEMKFLVDLQHHTYISEKSHQEIIDLAGLNPGGYDNYLKGWVKSDGTIKLWVETIEDIVFRYWDQIKLGFKTLIKEKMTKKQSKTYAIVNRIERYAGVVQNFVSTRNKVDYFEDQLGYAIQFYGQPKVHKHSTVMMLVNYKVNGNRYIFAGTRGKVMVPASGQAKKIRIKWSASHNGLMKPKGAIALLTDRRLLSLV